MYDDIQFFWKTIHKIPDWTQGIKVLQLSKLETRKYFKILIDY